MRDYYFQKRVLVTGGAGFIGSHLVDRLVGYGSIVVVVDNLITGSRNNLTQALSSDLCQLIEADVSETVESYLDKQKFDAIFHLASPASPKDFNSIPEEIYRVNSYGTDNLARFANDVKARFLFASTSEAYGDPLVHPQPETYFGNVNPIGPRACYDESKRFGEMVVANFIRRHDLDGRIVRIFNTYGPRMQTNDGRVIPNFISQALENSPITIHGDGSQTRSFCYVDELVEYILRAMSNDDMKGELINIGNPDEHTIGQIGEIIKSLTQSSSEFEYKPLPQDDPTRRKPDMEKAKRLLGELDYTSIEDGLKKTIDYFRLK